MIIHIMGASGSGTSTVGEFLSKMLKYDLIESDFFKWEQTVPEFMIMRPIEESNKLLIDRIEKSNNLIITGSLHSNPCTFKYINLIVYLKCPTKVRLDRIQKRDIETGRNSLQKSEEVRKNYFGFLELAKNYNKLGLDVRSKKSQKMVMKSCNAPVVTIYTNKNMDKLKKQTLKKVSKAIQKLEKNS